MLKIGIRIQESKITLISRKNSKIFVILSFDAHAEGLGAYHSAWIDDLGVNK